MCPYNGAGVFTPPIDFVLDAQNGIKILATRQMVNWNDYATNGLSNVITKDGQSTTTAPIPFAAGLQTNSISERTAGSGVTIDSVLLKDAQLNVSGPTNILGQMQGELNFLYSSAQKVTGVLPNATTEIFRFLDQTGTLIGTQFISGTFYINVVDEANPNNNTSVVRVIDTTGNGSTNASSSGLDAAIRGTAVISGFAVQNDGGGGGAKYAITTPNNGLTVTVRTMFIGMVK